MEDVTYFKTAEKPREKTIYDNYKSLAVAVIEVQVLDYLNNRHEYKREGREKIFENFCKQNILFDYLDIDREFFLEQCRKLKSWNIKKLKGINYE